MASQELTTKQKTFMEWINDPSKSRMENMIPDDKQRDRFTAVVVRAVQEDPSLLMVDDQRSLFLACQRAAQDGLIPDKREGALVVFSRKDGDRFVKFVQWMPMIGGVRKRLAHCGFDLVAEVVHENDTFHHRKGDAPSIEHEPPPLGQPRGDIIGAYAIAENLKTGKKYREVMDRGQIEEVRQVAKTDMVWKKWFSEQARKTVAKRLAKSLPLEDFDDSEEAQKVRDMIDRDNKDYYDLDSIPQASERAQTVQQKARARASQQPAIEHEQVTLEQEMPAGEEVPAEYQGEEPDF